MITVHRLSRLFLLLISILGLTVACSSPEKDWKEAQQADTADTYQRFASKYPNSPLAVEAKKRAEEKKWGEATRAESFVSYQKYLVEFPQGLHVAEAKKRIGLTAIRGTVVNAANGSAIEKCSLYLIEVGPSGQINATLNKDEKGVSDEHGNFSLFIERTKLSKMPIIAIFVLYNGGFYYSQPIHLEKIPDDTLILNIGQCKVMIGS